MQFLTPETKEINMKNEQAYIPPAPNPTPTPHFKFSSQVPVEKNAADVIMSDGWLLGTGSHAEWSKEIVDKDVELLDVLSLSFQHAKYHLVSLPHAFSMR